MEREALVREMEELAARCIGKRCAERPETEWLKEKYLEFAGREQPGGRREADCRLYERMYGKPPAGKSDLLKIRYWRTGRHVPVSHSQCRAFGRALGLEGEELLFLLRGYYDGCDEFYESEPPDEDVRYWERRAVMRRLTEAYLGRVTQERQNRLHIRPGELRQNLRHLYYTDAVCYVRGGQSDKSRYLEKHIVSAGYGPELARTLKLLGSVPRKTILRHLILLGAPEISLRWINEHLLLLGYLPLEESHTMRGGERLDWLLIRLLQRYEKVRCSAPGESLRWLMEACGILDGLFEDSGEQGLRFMYFKALAPY